MHNRDPQPTQARRREARSAGAVANNPPAAASSLAAKAVWEGEQAYRTLVESLDDAVNVKDVSGRYLVANSALLRHVGRSREEVIGKTALDLYPPAVARQIVEHDRQVLAHGTVAEFEAELAVFEEARIYQARKVPLRDESGAIVGIVTVSRDVTDHKRAAAVWYEMATLVQAFFADAPNPIFIVDEQGLYVDANPAALDFLECRQQALLGRAAADFLHPALAAQWRQEQNPFAARQTVETAYLVKGQTKTLLLSTVPLTLSSGKVVFVGIGLDITERKRAEEARRDSEERLQALSQRLVEVQEGERRNLARELHDEVGQLLTGLKLQLEMAARLPEAPARARLNEAQALVGRLLAQVRDLSLALRPGLLDDLGLLAALLWHVEHYQSRTRVLVMLRHRGVEGRRFPTAVETAAYRIVQEALTNVARHGGVNTAAVRLWVTGAVLGVQIEDQGRGFDPAAVLAGRLSSGIAGMRERASLLGGELTVESAPGKGTRVTAELPLCTSAEEDD